MPAILSVAWQPGRYLVARKELVVGDPFGLIRDPYATYRGLDQFGGELVAAGATRPDAVPFLGVAVSMLHRLTVGTQDDAGGTFGAAAPRALLRWPDHPLIGFGGSRFGFWLLGALCTSACATLPGVSFECAFVPAALAYAVFVLPHLAPTICIFGHR